MFCILLCISSDVTCRGRAGLLVVAVLLTLICRAIDLSGYFGWVGCYLRDSINLLCCLLVSC